MLGLLMLLAIYTGPQGITALTLSTIRRVCAPYNYWSKHDEYIRQWTNATRSRSTSGTKG